jgi:hypothetical protein
MGLDNYEGSPQAQKMDCSLILRRLSEIERAIGVLDPFSIRKMIIETQDYVLQYQKESAQTPRPSNPRIALSR